MPLKCRCVCGCKLFVSVHTAGKSIKCPKCEKRLRVPKDAVQRRRKQLLKKEEGRETNLPATEDKTPPAPLKSADPEPPPIQDTALERWEETPHPKREPKARQDKPLASDDSAAQTDRRKTPPPIPKRTTPEPDSEASESREFEKDKASHEPERVGKPNIPSAKEKDERTETLEHPSSEALSEDADPGEVEVIVRAYQPDRDKVATVRWLASALVVIAMFGVLPAALDITEHFQSEASVGISRWACALILLGALQLAYAAYLVQLPDWSSVWVVTILSLLIAGGYAAMCGLTFLSNEQSHFVQVLELADRLRGGKATAWCLIMLLLTSSMSYFSARVGARWRQAFVA